MGLEIMGDCSTCNQYSEGVQDGKEQKEKQMLEILNKIKKEHDYTCYCDEIIVHIKKQLKVK